MWWIVGILVVIIIILGFIIFNLLKKYEVLEDKLIILTENQDEYKSRINFITDKLKVIDSRGSFEADDEIGFFFKEIKFLANILNS